MTVCENLRGEEMETDLEDWIFSTERCEPSSR